MGKVSEFSNAHYEKEREKSVCDKRQFERAH